MAIGDDLEVLSKHSKHLARKERSAGFRGLYTLNRLRRMKTHTIHLSSGLLSESAACRLIQRVISPLRDVFIGRIRVSRHEHVQPNLHIFVCAFQKRSTAVDDPLTGLEDDSSSERSPSVGLGNTRDAMRSYEWQRTARRSSETTKSLVGDVQCEE